MADIYNFILDIWLYCFTLLKIEKILSIKNTVLSLIFYLFIYLFADLGGFIKWLKTVYSSFSHLSSPFTSPDMLKSYLGFYTTDRTFNIAYSFHKIFFLKNSLNVLRWFIFKIFAKCNYMFVCQFNPFWRASYFAQ